LCYAWCLMDNHYHPLLETPEPNLATGIRRLNQVLPSPSTGVMGASDMSCRGAKKAFLSRRRVICWSFAAT
jgi:hypothetical protein